MEILNEETCLIIYLLLRVMVEMYTHFIFIYLLRERERE